MAIKNKTVKKILSFVLLVLLSFEIGQALGFSFYVNQSDSIIGIEKLFGFAALVVLIYVLHYSKWTKLFILLPIVILAIAYLPVMNIYGLPTAGTIGSLVESDVQESTAFIRSIPLKFHLHSIALLVLFVCTSFCVSISKKTIAIMPGVFSLLIVLQLFMAQIPLLSFFKSLTKSVNDYVEIRAILQAPIDKKKKIKVTKARPKYKNYVIVIGESARKDYMSSFGYPLKTTPFFDSTKGVFVDGYIAAAPLTILSLTRTLTSNNGIEIDPNNNIISLAKTAGFKTYWLSNQLLVGAVETATSQIGIQANKSYFITEAIHKQKTYDDFNLLPFFQKTLNKKSTKSRLIVLHLIGSHDNFCQRLLDEPPTITIVNEAYGKNLSCYLSSIERTDHLMRAFVDLLKKSKESYSLIYFSDHGLFHNEGTLRHAGHTKQNYDVPLVKISSDDKSRVVIRAQKSAFNFLTGIGNWLGIESPSLDKNYTLFSKQEDKAIKVFNMDKDVPYDSLEEDPPMLPNKEG